MLASITPLGERGRGSRWGVTVAFFTVGSLVAAAAVGALLGELGRLTWPGPAAAGNARLAILAVTLAGAIVLDLGAGGLSIPSLRRQVNEDWLQEYRGWVYGLGFGFQLGLAVSTIVTTAAVYVTLVAAWLSADPLLGAAVTGAFGLARAASLLVAAGVTRPDRLVALHSHLTAWRGPGRRLAIAGQGALLVVALLGFAG
jgi:sulfite exporter TauE/SafE